MLDCLDEFIGGDNGAFAAFDGGEEEGGSQEEASDELGLVCAAEGFGLGSCVLGILKSRPHI